MDITRGSSSTFEILRGGKRKATFAISIDKYSFLKHLKFTIFKNTSFSKNHPYARYKFQTLTKKGSPVYTDRAVGAILRAKCSR